MRTRLTLLLAFAGVLAVPVAASAHPVSGVTSFMNGLGQARRRR